MFNESNGKNNSAGHNLAPHEQLLPTYFERPERNRRRRRHIQTSTNNGTSSIPLQSDRDSNSTEGLLSEPSIEAPDNEIGRVRSEKLDLQPIVQKDQNIFSNPSFIQNSKKNSTADDKEQSKSRLSLFHTKEVYDISGQNRYGSLPNLAYSFVDVEPREDLSSAEKIKKSTHHSETTMDELKMVADKNTISSSILKTSETPRDSKNNVRIRVPFTFNPLSTSSPTSHPNTFTSGIFNKSDIAQQLVEHHQTTQSSVFQIQKPNKSTSKNYLSPSTIGSLINRFAARRHKTDMPVRAMSWNESSNGYRERNVSATPPPPHTTESKPTPTRGLKSSDTKPKDLESSQQGITSMPQSLRRSFKWRSIFATPNPKNPKELHHASSANNVTNKTMSYTPTANTDIPNKPLIKNLGHSQAKTKPSPSNDLTKKCSFSSTCSGNSGIVPLETVFENEPTDEPSTSIQRESSALVRVKLREFNNNSSSKLSDGSIKSEAPAIAPRPFSVIGSSESSAHDEHSQMKYRLQMQQIYRIRVEDSNKLDAFISKRLPATPSSHQYSEVTRLERNSTETGLPYLNIEPRIRPHATTDQDFPKFEELCPTVAMNSLNDDGLNEMTAFVNIRPRRRRPRDSAGRSTVAVTASTLKRRKLSQFRHYNVNTNTATLGRRKSMNTQHLKASMNSEFLLSNLQHRTTEAILSRKESTKILAGPLLAKRKAKSYSTSSLRQIFYGGSDNRSLLKKAKVAAMEVSMENRLEKERKEGKANSMILGSIWSIRQRKKKDNNRSLANLFGVKQLSDSQCNSNDTESPKNDADLSLVEASDGNAVSPKHSSSFMLTKKTSFPADPSELENILITLPFPEALKGSWSDLDLWLLNSESVEAWIGPSLCAPYEGISMSERKRRSVIRELIETERHHCQVLIFLQNVYLKGLVKTSTLDDSHAKILIPDVVDDLIDFHVNFLRHLREHCLNNAISDPIYDLITDEFSSSLFKDKAVKAYTMFCLAQDSAYKIYTDLMKNHPNFRIFFNFYEKNSYFKGRDFKSCILLIAQRPTKYPILLHQINKYCTTVQAKNKSEKALISAKIFAHQIDTGKLEIEMKDHWESIKKSILLDTPGSMLGQRFVFADIVEPMQISDNEGNIRELRYICNACYQKVNSGQKINLRIILFDDLIVFLSIKNQPLASPNAEQRNTSLSFMEFNDIERKILSLFTIDDHSSAIPLHLTLIREMPRTNEIMLVIVARAKSDMFRLVFNNKAHLQSFVREANRAREKAPTVVRLSGDRVYKLETKNCSSLNPTDFNADEDQLNSEEKHYQNHFDKWLEGLQSLFEEQIKREDELLDYVVARMAFSDALREHVRNLPHRPTTSDEELTPAMVKREIKDLEKLKKSWNETFTELQRHRYTGMNSLLERANSMRDSDLPSIFDHLHDIAQSPLLSSCSPSSDGDSSCSSQLSNKPLISNPLKDDLPVATTPLQPSSSVDKKNSKISYSCELSKSKRLPRRVRTYHERVSPVEKSESASIRRHTTMPPTVDEINESSDDYDE